MVGVKLLSLMGVLGILSGFNCPTSQEKETKNIKVTIVTIMASKNNTGIDPRLKLIAREVRKKEPDLIGFRLAEMKCKSLPVNRKVSFQLVDKEVVEVTIKQSADLKNRVSLVIKPPCQGEISYRTTCGKFLPIITPYCSKKSRERLIIAIRVQPCHGD